MNRRNFFKALTGFVAGVFAAKKSKADVITFPTEESAEDFSNKRIRPRSMSAKEWVEAQYNPVKELQLGEPFTGKIVSMTTFQGNLWIATEEGVYRIREGL